MAKCNFCRKAIEPGTGMMFIKNDGSIFNFCSTKCRKSLMALKRDPAAAAWAHGSRKKKMGGRK